MSKDFRVIFMGTPEFAVASLKAIIDAGFNVVGVVTAPDRPAGRGQKVQESDVKQFAKSLNVPVLQPEKLKNPEFIEQLKELNADLQVVVAFRMLPEVIWSMPRMGTINLHASLLPQYRGAAPINWAIINGDTKTGVTTFFIEKEIDTGKIIYSGEVEIIETDNAGTLHDKLMITGANLLVRTINAIKDNNYPQVDQVVSGSLSAAPKIFKETCRVNWADDIEKTYNFIRGLSPYPAAWTVLQDSDGETLSVKVFESIKEPVNHNLPSGIIVSDDKTYIKVALAGGYLYITNLQLEGKKRLTVEEFLRGFKNIHTYRFV
jgi:methionyl-tRNA formyltransferase